MAQFLLTSTAPTLDKYLRYPPPDPYPPYILCRLRIQEKEQVPFAILSHMSSPTKHMAPPQAPYVLLLPFRPPPATPTCLGYGRVSVRPLCVTVR